MTTPHRVVGTIFRKLGGRQALGEEVSSEADFARIVSCRLPLKVLRHVELSGFSKREIEDLIIPARTQRHRKERKEPLTVEESDRLVRLTRIQTLAEDVFADVAKADV